ncbi:MAG: hypothetical protein LBL95_04625 [Deltaproteobacteria bacterium]|nr:hypothetical protein [Deltaproteobacteria bacterium]
MKRSEMIGFIQNLNAREASQVLNNLLSDNHDLTKKAYEIAKKVATDLDVDAIMDEVFFELDNIDLDDMNGRAGRTRHGYVEPSEAAWEIFEEALNPFIDEMKKNQQRKLPSAAKAYCIGIIKGLRKYEETSSSDFKEWVTDAPGEFVYSVIGDWEEGNPSDDDIAEVMIVAEGDDQG